MTANKATGENVHTCQLTIKEVAEQKITKGRLDDHSIMKSFGRN